MAGWTTPGVTAPTAATKTLPIPQESKLSVDTQLASGQYPQTVAPTVQQLLASRHGTDVGGDSAVTYGATVTLDASKTSYFAMTFGAGNCTGTFTNLTPGQLIYLKLTQDGTGSRTFTPAVSGGTLVTSGTPLSTAAGAVDLVAVWTPDGTSLFYYPIAKAFA